MAFRYLIHGIVLDLPFACAELAGHESEDAADVVVREGPVARRLAEAVVRDPVFDLAPRAYLHRGGRHSGRFLAEHGERIIFERNPGCREPLFVHQLLHPVMAALLWQRGRFVLHASAAVSPDGVVLVTGDSGAGKSTTTANLVAQGLRLLSDDLAALRIREDGTIEVSPGGGRLRLDEAAADRLAIGTEGLERLDWNRMKIAIPGDLAADPGTVSRIVHLERGDGDLRIDEVVGRDKLGLLLRGVYAPVLAEQQAAQHALLAAALESVPMIAIARPEGDWTGDAIAEAILA